MNDNDINALVLRLVLASLSADEDSFIRAVHEIPACGHCVVELVRCLSDWCAMFTIRSEDGHDFSSCAAAVARMEQLIAKHLDQAS